MPRFADNLWYGTAHGRSGASHTGPRSDVVQWGVLFLFLLVLRLFLPFCDTDTMKVHEAIAEAIRQQQNWGRQAFVASWEFPPLTTVAVLAVNSVAGLLHIDGQRLLVAFAQAWAFCYVLRLPESYMGRIAAVSLSAVFLLVPQAAGAFCAVDPNWITVVPVCSIVFHLSRWQRLRSLRDAILCAVNAGLLVFAGLPALMFGIALVVVLTIEFHHVPGLDANERKGTAVLLCSPMVYCLLCLVLLNWLIMGDMLFCFRSLWQSLLSSTGTVVCERFGHGVISASALTFGAVISLVCLLQGRMHESASCMLIGLAAALVGVALCAGIGVSPASGTLVVLALSLLALSLPWLQRRPDTSTPHAGVCGVLLVLSILGGFLRPSQPHAADTDYMLPAPARNYVTRWIDQHWDDSRIVICGIRAPAIYPDPTEKRFLARVDFFESRFIKQAHDEQLHLLIPPPTGVFYPAGQGTIADIYRRGRPWLLLERSWPDGWQLWRCVIPPEGESKLDEIRATPIKAR